MSPWPASVIICTHDPRPAYFDRCIDGLKQQTLPPTDWELIVVDNASSTGREPRVDLSWHPAGRCVFEGELGLTPARLRGISESQGELLVFVDDDNVLDDDFIEAAIRVAQERPFLGSWSGQCRPEFEEPPPEWTRRYWGNLVIRQFDEDVWSNLPRLADTMPCGAGLCVRRAVAQEYRRLHESGARSFQLDRTGPSLISGGDNDLAASACNIGFGIGLIASLKLTHLIPPDRLTEEYLSRLAEGIHLSSTLLDAEREASFAPYRSLRGHVADWLRILHAKPPHRTIARAAYRGRNRALRMLASGASPPIERRG